MYHSFCELKVSDVYLNAWGFDYDSNIKEVERPLYKRMHQHLNYEIFLVVGHLSINVENIVRTYENQIVIISPWKSHCVLPDDRYKGSSMMFNLEQIEGKNIGFYHKLTGVMKEDIVVMPMDESMQLYTLNFTKARRAENDNIKCSLLASLIFLGIFSELFPKEKFKFEKKESRKTNLNKLDNYISAYFNEDITLDKVAGELGLSSRRISSILKENYDCTFTQMIHRKRLNMGALLLKTTEMTSHNISQVLGYENENYFFQLFRNEYGMSPQQYRNSIKTVDI